MKLPLAGIVGLLLYSLAVASSHAQILIGFAGGPPPLGPYEAVMSSDSAGTLAVGDVAAPITFGFSESGPPWQKNFSIPISLGIATGAEIGVTEFLKWDGTGPSPFTDWHEVIPDGAPFIWTTGIISIGSTPGSIPPSSGGKIIDFFFPPAAGIVEFTINKILKYTGDPIAPFPVGTLGVTIIEQPSVPEPQHAALLSGCLIALWAVGRRIYRLHHA